MGMDILELAREAGLGTVLCHNSVEGDRVWIEGADWHDELERFAALLEAKVRADERKKCAAICRKEAAETDKHLSIVIEALEDCAYLIEKRGEE
jgi:hypothetical protein